MQRLLSDGLLIIAMHSALLFRNHYEARVRSLTSFSLADLLVLTMRGGREGTREERETGVGGGVFLYDFEEMEEGRPWKEKRGQMNI